jgi:carbon storage regulator
MLVLSRKIGEQIVIPGSEVVITVLSCRGRAVRLGIAAPDDVAVYRRELWLRRNGATIEPNTTPAQ